MVNVKNILAASDFSETSDYALEYAVEMAKRFDARLHVLHVVPDPYGQPWSIEATGVAVPELLETWEREARERLDNMKLSGLEATRVVQVGHAFVQIVRYARDAQVDLIVMGTHGRGAIGHMFLGSVAEKVVRKAPCPVLTVRLPNHQFERP